MASKVIINYSNAKRMNVLEGALPEGAVDYIGILDLIELGHTLFLLCIRLQNGTNP